MTKTRHGISQRTVTRYYFRGKGYATKAAAYRALAKLELDSIIWERRIEKYRAIRENTPSWSHREIEPLFRQADAQVMAEMFSLGCGKTNDGIGLTSMWHGPTRPGMPTTGWCNGCRWDWIRSRAKALQAEDEQVLALPAPSEGATNP